MTTTEAEASAETEKVTLRLAGDAMRKVREQARRKGISVNEFLRRALGTEVYFQEQIDSGGRILVEKADKTMREVVLR